MSTETTPTTTPEKGGLLRSISDVLCLLNPFCILVSAGGTVSLTAATRAYAPKPLWKLGLQSLAAAGVVAIAARAAARYTPRDTRKTSKR